MIKEKTHNTKNIILKNFLTSRPGDSGYEQLKEEARKGLFDPGLIEESHLSPESLRTEARIISDAFEAVTNGMHNPEAFESMLEIPDDSVLGDWKNIITAIRDFYSGDKNNMTLSLEKIDPDSPLAPLKTVLNHLTGGTGGEEPKGETSDLVDEIIKDRSFIRSVIEQLAESLEYDMEDVFLDTAVLLMRDLNRSYPETAGRFYIWSIKTASSSKYSPSDLITNARKLFRNTEAYRLTAVALAEDEPDISLLFWIQSAVSRLKYPDSEYDEIMAYLAVIKEAAASVAETDDRFYLESLKGLVKNLSAELQDKFPDKFKNQILTDNPLDDLHRLYTGRDPSGEQAAPADRPEKSGFPQNSPARVNEGKGREPVQLSLFDQEY